MIEQEKESTGIEGAWLQPLQIIPTEGGPVLHMLRGDYSLMPSFPEGFGEIYFSEVLPGSVKAWKRHMRQTQLFAVPAGEILIALWDGRPDSQTFGELRTLRLGRPDNYKLLSIPPGVWYGFKGISPAPALICNCADLPHDPSESGRLPADSSQIPFNWSQAPD